MPALLENSIITGDNGSKAAAGSLSDKLAREGSLALSAAQGIGKEAVNTIKHPQVRLIEAGVGLALNAGLTVLSKGEFAGIARAIELGFGVSFAKQIFSSSGNLLAAGANAWNSSKDMERDKAIAASTVGNFVVDGGALAIGAALGSKFVGEPLTRRLWQDAAANAPRQSTFNISYDNPLKPLRSADVADPLAVNAELRSLLGYSKPLEVNGTSVELGTKYGTAKLEPYYSRQRNVLSLDLRSPASLKPVSVEFSLDSAGVPQSVTVQNDGEHFLPKLLESKGYSNLAEAIGNPTDGDFALADRFGKIDWAAANSQLEALKAAAGKTAMETNPLNEDALFVAQKSARIAPIGTALGTTDLMTCTGLAVVDKADGRQLLAHVDHATNPDLLRQALASFDLSKAEIYLMEGDGNAFSANAKLMGSAERALAALGNDPAVLSKVHFVSSGGTNNMVIQNGKVYADAKSYI